ncbi:hypothetical protein LTS18_003816 [Coniosporium uncinatum]|uniref:Uncharacterized protein n=1 Tax=Coniosporium uncinatum TaxID=93489 RepID=A0ACC3DZ01_9PEZI|nr:hypothetical protein LTS18_003816 [Coniosporium uncinatum]
MPYESHRLTATTEFAGVLQSSVHTSICDATLPHPEASPHTLPLPQGSVKWYDKTLEESAEKRIQTGHKLMTWTLKEQQLQWQCGPKAPRGRCGAGTTKRRTRRTTDHTQRTTGAPVATRPPSSPLCRPPKPAFTHDDILHPTSYERQTTATPSADSFAVFPPPTSFPVFFHPVPNYHRGGPRPPAKAGAAPAIDGTDTTAAISPNIKDSRAAPTE